MKGVYGKVLLIGASLILASSAPASSLQHAVNNNNIESVKLIIQSGVDINQIQDYAFEGSALHVAVRAGRQEIAQLLINSGAMVDIRDHNDYTPLHNAAWNGNLNMVKLLLESGADIRATNYEGHTPLSCAKRNNKVEVIEFIEGELRTTSN